MHKLIKRRVSDLLKWLVCQDKNYGRVVEKRNERFVGGWDKINQSTINTVRFLLEENSQYSSHRLVTV